MIQRKNAKAQNFGYSLYKNPKVQDLCGENLGPGLALIDSSKINLGEIHYHPSNR